MAWAFDVKSSQIHLFTNISKRTARRSKKFFTTIFSTAKCLFPVKLGAVSEWDHFFLGGKRKRRLQQARGRARHSKDIILDGQERFASSGKGKRKRVTMLVPREDQANTHYRIQQHTRSHSEFPFDIIATDCGSAVVNIPNRKQMTVNHSRFFVDPKSRKLGETLSHINGVEGSHFPIQFKAKSRRGGNRVRNKMELVSLLDEYDFDSNFTNGSPEDRFFSVLLMPSTIHKN